jgi:alkylated DNA repair dioxygenase AlkB
MPGNLFGDEALPPGFLYRAGFITRAEEAELLAGVAGLEFAAVEMRGVVARRRTAHFGWTYGYYARRTTPGPPLPAFLIPYRDRAAQWADISPDAFVEALVTEYPEGAPIGWHRDAPMFGDIIAGISLGAASRMKFRPYVSPAAPRTPAGGVRRTTHELELAPRSGYLITGKARRDFEHSIPPVESRRYSITFRTLRAAEDAV